jgi:hypothetical protein
LIFKRAVADVCWKAVKKNKALAITNAPCKLNIQVKK